VAAIKTLELKISMPKNNSIKIRRATIDDATILAEIGLKSFYDAFAHDPHNKPKDMKAYMDEAFNIETIKADLMDANVVYFVAEIEEAMVGYAKLKAESTEPCVVARKPIELCRLYALSEWIGHGIGAALMNECLDEARKREHDVMWLGVWEFNHRARKFYAKFGFEKCGEHIFQLGEDAQTDWVLQREV
jgi:ribosomal protein S18 acetylase RimI-like enzyme